jgi:hypothetical protein
MLRQRRLRTPAWSKGAYKPTASTKSVLTVLSCELGQTTAPRSGSRACRAATCNQYEFDFTDAARSRFAVYALLVLGVGWKHLRRRLGYSCAYEQGYSVSMYLQNFSDTLLANIRRTIEE